MDALDRDVEALEAALQAFFRTMKRPQNWTNITRRAGVNIDRPAAHILRTMLMHDPKHCRVQDLAQQLGIEAPSVTRKTQELEQAGYLNRVPDPKDKRAIGLSITPRGRNLSTKLWKIQRLAMAEAMAEWPAKDRQQFTKLFSRFATDLEATYDRQINPADVRKIRKEARVQ